MLVNIYFNLHTKFVHVRVCPGKKNYNCQYLRNIACRTNFSTMLTVDNTVSKLDKLMLMAIEELNQLLPHIGNSNTKSWLITLIGQ